jgi:hypothetical protein
MNKEGTEHKSEKKMPKRETEIKMGNRLGMKSHRKKEDNGMKLRKRTSCGKIETDGRRGSVFR